MAWWTGARDSCGDPQGLSREYGAQHPATVLGARAHPVAASRGGQGQLTATALRRVPATTRGGSELPPPTQKCRDSADTADSLATGGCLPLQGDEPHPPPCPTFPSADMCP